MRWHNRIAAGRQAGMTPLFFTIGFLLLMGIWTVFDLPEPSEMYEKLVLLFREHGLLIIGLAALLEGMVLVNVYVPGSAVILVGMASSRGNSGHAVAIIAIVSISFILTAHVNYMIGYFGLHTIIERCGGKNWLRRSHEKYEKYGVLIVPPSFIHPNLGACMSVCCGSVRLRLMKFTLITTVSILVWNIIWGVLAYTLGKVLSETVTNPLLILWALMLWCGVSFGLGCARANKISATLGA